MRKFLRLTAIAAITSVPFVGCSDDDTIGFTPDGEAGTGGTGSAGRAGSGGVAGAEMSGSGGMVATAGMGGVGGGAAGEGGSAGSSGDECSLTECGSACVDTATTEAHCGSCDRACSNANASASACTAGVCGATCNAGFADCSVDDGSGADDGCETDLNENTLCGTTCENRVPCDVGQFCVDGACGTTCESPNTQCGDTCESLDTATDHCNACDRACSGDGVLTLACVAGACTPECDPGFGDCSVDVGSGTDDGCETNLGTTADDCGACDRACDSTNTASLVCTDGTCAPNCNVGFADCEVDDGNGADDGCETDLSSAQSCGTTCGDRAVCVAGDICQNGVCTPPCALDECGAECVDTQITSAHCGACDRACGNSNTASLACVNGLCDPSCSSGFADCIADTGANDDGCETNLNSSATCGLACGATVACSGSDTCENGVCTATCTQTTCGAECVDTATATAHCGACDRACSTTNVTGSACSGGLCAPVCAADFGDCNPDTGSGADDGCETDFNAAATCGTTCGNIAVCTADESCVNGVCTANCAFAQCGGQCVDTATTTAHCGACDRACLDDAAVASTSCSSGLCGPVCEAGFADCSVDNGTTDDGCETNLNSDASCGTTCGNRVVCTAGKDCVSGVCTAFNLVPNPSAENAAISPWVGVSGGVVALTTAQANTGVQSVTSVGRNQTFQGVGVEMLGLVVQGRAYTVRGFMRTSAASTNAGRLSGRADCQGGPSSFLFIAQTAVSSTAWTQLSGTVTVPTLAACATMTSFRVYFENADNTVQILADDMTVLEQ